MLMRFLKPTKMPELPNFLFNFNPLDATAKLQVMQQVWLSAILYLVPCKQKRPGTAYI